MYCCMSVIDWLPSENSESTEFSNYGKNNILEQQPSLHSFNFVWKSVKNMARWNWSFALLFLFATCIFCNKQEEVEGFFSQSGHTNNWAVLVSTEMQHVIQNECIHIIC